MKILYPVPNGMLNPHIYEQADAINKYTDAEVTVSLDEFWRMEGNYDIVHVQWPEALVSWKYTEESNQKLQKVITTWKVKAKIITSCLNLYPHNSRSESAIQLYHIIYENSDVLVHFGESSKEIFTSYNFISPKYQVVIPQPIYSSYPNEISAHDARKVLNINQNAFVVLSFGMLRNTQEKQLLRSAFGYLKTYPKVLLTPWWTFSSNLFYRQWEKMYYKLHPNYHLHQKKISNEEVQYYFNASDIFFLSRVQPFNSGNLILAYYFGKIVVGPESGNIGEILKSTGNPVYKMNNTTSLIDAMQEALELSRIGKGKENQDFAHKYWAQDLIANKLYELYNNVTK